MGQNSKTYYPEQKFDNKYEQLVGLCIEQGWTLPGIDLKALQQDAAAQRAERKAHDEAMSRSRALHEAFGVAQQERYKAFFSMLSGLRGMFRDSKDKMALLEGFKREMARGSRKAKAAAVGTESDVALVK